MKKAHNVVLKYARIQETSCSTLNKKQAYLETTCKLVSSKFRLVWSKRNILSCRQKNSLFDCLKQIEKEEVVKQCSEF